LRVLEDANDGIDPGTVAQKYAEVVDAIAAGAPHRAAWS
jgi:hypothetical protein